MDSLVLHQFIIPKYITYGKDALQTLPEILRKINGKRPLIVTGKKISEMPFINLVLERMKQDGVTPVVANRMEGEPTTEHVKEGIEIFASNGCDSVIGIGGGSRLDVAKAVSVVATNGGSIKDYEGWEKVRRPPAPLIAVNTTAGTGSEVTQAAIITDLARNLKMVIASPLMMPEYVIDDPVLTLTMPPDVTAFTGMDALTHAVEGYVAKRAQPLTDLLAIEAISRITRSLPKAYIDPNEMAARNDVMYGSLLSGIIINQTKTALVHGMARPLGAYFKIPHGLCNAILIPYVLAFSAPANYEKFKQILQAMGYLESVHPLEIGMKIGSVFFRLCRNLGVPSLAQLGIRRAEFFKMIPRMTDDAVSSGFQENGPRKATAQDIRRLYEQTFEEDLEKVLYSFK